MKKPDNELQLDFLKADDSKQGQTNNNTSLDKALTEENVFAKPTSKRKRGKGIIITLALIIFFVSALLYVKVSASPLGLALSGTNWLSTLKHLISNQDKAIIGENEDRINILLLGMGGTGHDGAYLTDTIMVASFRPSTKQVALVSIPRDLYVEIDDYGWRKVNNANAFGEINDYPGSGAALAAKTIEQVIGQPIHYWVRIDFSGFRQLIDDLGGVDIYVEQAFTDPTYPDYQHGVQTISFNEGQQHLDGERALQFARSRHGTNGQGSDFSRSKRQMQILLAVKEKVMSAGTLLNPNKLSDLYDNLTQNIVTNIKLWEAIRLANLGKSIRQADIINKVIDNGPNGLLISYISDTGAYVLAPKSGDFSSIHKLFSEIFDSQEIKKENSKIIIYNGTNITGLANQIASTLKQSDYDIVEIDNAPTRDWNETVIYDLTDGDKPNSQQFLTNTLSATLNTNLPFDIQEKILHDNPAINLTEEIDFVIILGADQNI